MAAKTTSKVALLSAAAKDDVLVMNSVGGLLNVLGNDPGSSTLFGVYKSAGTMVNGVTPVDQVKACLQITTALGGVVKINTVTNTLTYTPPATITAAQFLAAAAGDVLLTDHFSYVAKMGNDGALSLANVTFSIVGVNDTAVIGGNDKGSVVEDTQETTTGALTISDPDHDQNTFAAGTQTGAYGSLSLTTAGVWTYNLGTQSLWAGESHTDSFVVKSIDGTAHTVTVLVTGANDAATFTGDDAKTTDEDTSTGGTIVAADVDHDQSSMQASDQTGAAGSLHLNTDGSWTYTNDPADNAMQAGESVVDTFHVQSFDGTSHDITVTVIGLNDDATFTGDDSGSTDEDTPTGGTLVAADVDHDQSAMQASTGTGTVGDFAIGTDGAWTYTPGEAAQAMQDGESTSETFTVHSVDGTSHDISVIVYGVNDDATFNGDVSATTDEDAGSVGGNIGVGDVDHDQASMQAFDGDGAGGSLHVNEDGTWLYTVSPDDNAMPDGTSIVDTFTVHSADGTAQDIVVTVMGLNDEATVSGTDTGSVDEDGTLTTGGTLGVTDPDTGENVFGAVGALQGAYGLFSFDSDTGAWGYTLDNSLAAVQALNTGDTLSDSLSVASADGTGHDTVTVTINGLDEPLPPPGGGGGGGGGDDPNGAVTTFVVNHGLSWINEGLGTLQATFNGFDGNDILQHSANYAYVGKSLIDTNNDSTPDSTQITFFDAGSSGGNGTGGTTVHVVLVGYTDFHAGQLTPGSDLLV